MIVCYVRQSRDRGNDELAVSRQLKVCREVAERRKLAVSEVIQDNDESASKRGRPGYSRLVEMVESGAVNTVIILRVDRLLRLNDELEELIQLVERTGLKVITCEGDIDLSTPQGRLMARILVSVARSEIEVKSARQRLSNEQRAEAGLPHAGRRAFGYETDGMTLRENEAVVLKDLAARFLDGYSYNELAAWLNQTGVVTAMGNRWYSVAVRQMLQRKRYAGIREYNGVEFSAAWPAVWDADTWERIKYMVKKRSEKGAIRPRRHLLTGLLFCGACDAPMNGMNTYSRQTGEPKRAYRCNRRRGGCGRVTRGAVPLEWWLSELIFYRLDTPELLELVDSEPGMSDLIREKATLEARINGLVDDYADGTLSKSDLQRAKARLEARVQTVEQQMGDLHRDETLSGLVTVGESVRSRWEVETDGWRRSMIELLVERITVNPSRKLPRTIISGRTYYFDGAAVDVLWKV